MKKGQVGPATVPITLVVVAVTIIVGVLVFTNTYDALPALTGDANTTATSVRTTAFDAFQLLVIVLIVLAAVAILSVLFLLQGRGR